MYGLDVLRPLPISVDPEQYDGDVSVSVWYTMTSEGDNNETRGNKYKMSSGGTHDHWCSPGTWPIAGHRWDLVVVGTCLGPWFFLPWTEGTT